MPPESALLLEKEWITEETVAIYVDYERCKGKEVQIYENQGQKFLLARQVKNMWCGSCQEV